MKIITRKTLLGVFTLAGLLLTVGCTSSTPPKALDSNENLINARECAEPENPYEEGTGHYAGFDWAENHAPSSCGGDSQSFIEGCEEYERLESEYQQCEAEKKN